MKKVTDWRNGGTSVSFSMYFRLKKFERNCIFTSSTFRLPLSDGSKLAALFQVCENRIPRGTFSYKFSWKTYLKNCQFVYIYIYLIYLRKIVIFHSYVSSPEGYRVMFCHFFSHGTRVSTQVPPASRTRIIRYLESQVYKDRCESRSMGP